MDTFAIGMMSGLDDDLIAKTVKTVKSASEEKVQEIIRFIQERVRALMQ